ncbi:MAG TPA: hypothetical protein VKT71_11950 [Candidatus Acidoferrales bacterium]|nr:hypothetical protein [Candidatus Acidoferrales bacterium]
MTDVRYHRTVRMGTPVGERSKSWGRRHCYCVGAALISAVLAATVAARPAIGQSQQTITQPDEPEANPARPTVSNPATLTPVGYLQFETGMLGATYSLEFSTRYEFNEVIKLAVTRRLEFVEASEPTIHYTVNGISANGVAEVFLGAQVVLLPGEGAKPTLSASYSRRIYDGGAPELDVGSPLNSSVLYASADVMGFHYDANAIFNEVLDGRVRRLQFGQTLSVSHPLGKGFGLSGEIWRFSQPFERGNAIGNLWAASYAARKTLVFDAGFEKGLTGTSTHWEAFAGLTYLLPHRLCKR